VTEGRLVPEAVDAGTSTGTESDAALDGGPDEAGQDGGGVGERVRGSGVVSGLEMAAREDIVNLVSEAGVVADRIRQLLNRYGPAEAAKSIEGRRQAVTEMASDVIHGELPGTA
jgi:hypothetical protein